MDEKTIALVLNAIPFDANPEEKYLAAKGFIEKARQDPELSRIIFGRNVWQELLERDCDVHHTTMAQQLEEYLKILYHKSLFFKFQREENKTAYLKSLPATVLHDYINVVDSDYKFYIKYLTYERNVSMFGYLFVSSIGWHPDITRELIKDIPEYIKENSDSIILSSIIMLSHTNNKEENLCLFHEIMDVGMKYWQVQDFEKAFNSIHFPIEDIKLYIRENYLTKKKL